MERYPKKLEKKEIQDLADYISLNAVGINILSAVPTNADLKSGTINLYGDDIYIKFPSGKVLKFTGTNVT